MKLLLGKGHFFSLLLGEVVMHCQEAVRGQEWDPPRPDTPTHRGWMRLVWKCANTDLCSKPLGRWVQP